MNTMIDKSVAISQLNLVRDVQEHIKSYLFYDAEQVFLRKEKNKYINEIKNADSQRLWGNHWIFKTQSHQFQVLFCHRDSCVKCLRH
jgi:hypothetical protein